MAAAIILRGFLALFIAGAVSMVFIPVMYNMETNPALWNGTSLPAQAFVVRDQVYAVYQYSPLIGTGAVVAWMFINAARRDPQEY